ncbi:uncharacterized protein ELE39_000946 [Cryptosporidium sp. chipmunk genotype I]|uniref:uncharacterized protein n=1 Tax=Cryptosporidium sp. chipmunk genotype I TaxID=1280935 RepID=UPI00351A4014|nr:hypothetical protein ELE39_000946 [Cryptosporidium sp. chipmunk genotype I]
MTFNIFVEYFYILVIIKVNYVISLRSNKFSSIKSPISILSELGEYSVNLKIIELQKKVDFCSSSLSKVNNELISARLRIAEKSKENNNHKNEEELIAKLTKKVREIGLECNSFVDLLLLKRINCFNQVALDDDVKTETNVKEKINNIVNNLVITENNAPFIRSLIYKVKCHSFSTNEHCKLLTSKLFFYMAVTPKEIIENFENIKLVDTE